MRFYDILESPIDRITIASDGMHLRELHLANDRYFTAIPGDWIYMPQNSLLKQAHDELEAYFSGTKHKFSVPIAFDGTEFQKQVWHALQNIPYGQTMTYANVAAQIGKPKAVRAVGTAVGRNPLCIIVPCHRVITSSGGLGGYVAGLQRKRYLLDLERNVA